MARPFNQAKGNHKHTKSPELLSFFASQGNLHCPDSRTKNEAIKSPKEGTINQSIAVEESSNKSVRA